MSKFLVTLKYSLINSLAINKLKKKSNLNKLSFFKVFLLIVFILFLFMASVLYAFIFGEAFNSVGEPETILSLGIMFSVVMSLILTITNASSFLFKSKDFDLLMSLPLKEKTVVATKIAYLLLINYVLFFFIYIPTLVVYSIYVETSVVFWLLAIITMIIGPLLPIAVSTILAYFLSIIIPKFKYKNLITILFSIVLLVFIFLLSFTSSMISEDPSGFSNSVKAILSKTGEWAYNGMRGNYLDYLYFVLISIIPFILFYRLIGKFYLKANTKFSSSSSKSNYKMGELNTQSQSLTLIKKEFSRYFSSPMYVLNTIIGPLLSTIMLVSFRIFKESFLAEIGVPIEAITFLPVILVALIIFSLGLTSTTASSISIEGKQFWILKSAPITPSQVFHGKIFVNFLITIPFVIINTIISVFVFDLGVVDYFMIFIIPLIFSVFMSYLGLYVNLIFPRFDYENDVKIVKQSLSVTVTMGIGFVLASLTIGLGALTLEKTNSNLYAYLVGLVMSLIICLTTIMLTYKHGTKIYKRIVI